jgi:hypothetical protein
MNNKTFKLVEVNIRRGLREKGKKEMNQFELEYIYIYTPGNGTKKPMYSLS